MSVLAVIQARMSSTRLPGKTLADVGGEAMLALMLKRLERLEEVDEVVVATSTEPEDDAIAEASTCRVVRGPLDDVLSRFVQASEGHDGPVVRLTADCPLTDPALVDETVRLFRGSYASNIDPRSYPDGLDVGVVSKQALLAANCEARDPYDREHVTTWIRRQPKRFPRSTLVNDEDLGEVRWAIDEIGDLEFLRALASRLDLHDAGYKDVLEVIRDDKDLLHAGGLQRG